jgi:hypothetical protein
MRGIGADRGLITPAAGALLQAAANHSGFELGTWVERKFADNKELLEFRERFRKRRVLLLGNFQRHGSFQ